MPYSNSLGYLVLFLQYGDFRSTISAENIQLKGPMPIILVPSVTFLFPSTYVQYLVD